MSENTFNPTPYERLQLFVGKRQINRERRALVSVGLLVASLAMLTAVDMTDATVDACYYSFDGKGDSLGDVASSFQWQEPPENCTPSIDL